MSRPLYSEEWLAERLAKHNKVDPLTAVIRKHGFEGAQPVKEKPVGKQRGEVMRLILPFKLPTWNQLLAMDQWQRAKVRNWIKERVSECIQSGEDLQTPMGLARKLSLTDLSLREYSLMITPNSSRKYRTAKKQAAKNRPLSK